MTELIVSPAASKDIDGIWRHIASHDPVAADRILEELAQTCDRLALLPGSGRPRPEVDDGIRSTPVGHYFVFHRREERSIEVVRVLHGARDADENFRNQ